MAKGLNRCTFIGNVGKAAEVRATQGGSVMATFSLAVAGREPDGRGGWQEKTDWVNCIAFKRLAEIVRDYTSKGSRLYVEGRLQNRSWEKDGQKHYRTEIVLADVTLLDGRKADRQNDGAVMHSSLTPDYADQGITDDDVPF